jgi:hypothetical protein
MSCCEQTLQDFVFNILTKVVYRTPGETAVTVSTVLVFAGGSFTVALLQASLKTLKSIHFSCCDSLSLVGFRNEHTKSYNNGVYEIIPI